MNNKYTLHTVVQHKHEHKIEEKKVENNTMKKIVF